MIITGSDERWTVSVQYTDEDIDANIVAFKEVVHIVKASGESMPMVEAI